MGFSSNIFSYHGTSPTYLDKLIQGKIDVTIGGGELGRGFYTGDRIDVAKAWAAHRHKRSKAVVCIEMTDKDFFATEPLPLGKIEALEECKAIKKEKQTRTFLFNRNCIWAPIIGTTRIEAEQYKWESQKAQELLNSDKVVRTSK